MEKKRITISVSPLLVLLAVIILAGIIIIKWGLPKKEKTLTIADTPVVTTSIRNLGELATACFYDEIVLSRTKPGPLSSTTLGSIARDGFGRDVDDHLVVIARGSVRAGIDFRDMEDGSVFVSGDTLVVKLPSPKYLDVIINPSDFEVFAESGNWTQREIAGVQEEARAKLISEADAAALKSRAYEGAEESVTQLLSASGYNKIRFEHPSSYIPLPRLRD